MRKAILVAALALTCAVGCTSVPRPTVTVTSPTATPAPVPTAFSPVMPQPTETQDETMSPSPSVSPEPSEEPSDDETTQAPPDGELTLIGEVVYYRSVEDGSGRCDATYQTDVVLEVADNTQGIKGVQFYDSEGEIGQPDSLGKMVRITIQPDDYREITLQEDDEPFPTTDHCTKGTIPSSLYGERFLEDVPYNAATWETIK